jgi:hypothetical protein
MPLNPERCFISQEVFICRIAQRHDQHIVIYSDVEELEIVMQDILVLIEYVNSDFSALPTVSFHDTWRSGHCELIARSLSPLREETQHGLLY